MQWRLEQFLQSGSPAILEAMDDAISVQNPELRVIYQNPAHIRLMGDHLGRYCYEGYQKRTAACPDCHLLRAFRQGKANRRVASTSHSQRGLVHVEIISSPLRDDAGDIVAGIEVVRDITERKLMDEKLNAITSDLEQKSWKLMAANRELESFSYTLSHDMKNYLARITLSLDALTNVCAKELDDTGRFLVGNIAESCSAMEEMIDAILLLSGTGNSDMAQNDVDLGRLAQEIGIELNCQYPERSVDFAVADGMHAVGDRQLLKVMLRNLLGNSWKYTATVADARIAFFVEKHEGKNVFVVRDNGVGFDMNDAGKLFKPFCRLSGSEGVKGLGIGLATVRRIVLSHGGDIWGEGVPGNGATFYFTLPQLAE